MLIPDSFRWLGIKPRNGIFAWVWTFLCFTVRFLVFLGRALFLKGLQMIRRWLSSCILGPFPAGNSKKKPKTASFCAKLTTGENPKLRRTFIFHPNWILGGSPHEAATLHAFICSMKSPRGWWRWDTGRCMGSLWKLKIHRIHEMVYWPTFGQFLW